MTHPTPTLRIVAILSLLLLTNTPTFGVSITWDATTNNTWDTTTVNWTGDLTTYTDGDDVLFGDTGAGTVGIDAGDVTPASTSINSDLNNNYTFTGDSIRGGTLTKSGTSIATLDNDANDFSGITINSGTLRFDDPNQLGAGPISFEGSSSLEYTGDPATVISGSSAINMNAGACRLKLGGATLSRDVNGITALARIHDGVLSGTITDYFQVGGDTVKLTGTNNQLKGVYLGYNGQSGVLEISDSSNLSSDGTTGLNFNIYGGTLRITGEPTSNFTDSISITGSGGTTPVIEVQEANASVNWTGSFDFGDGAAVVKDGAGSLTLANITSGAGGDDLSFTVSDGTLNINDNDSGTGAFGNVTVQNGGTLGGTGTIDLAASSSLAVVSGGTLAPGASIGTLTMDLVADTTSVTLASGAVLEFELDNPGTGDLLQFNNFTDGELALSDNVINFTDAGGLAYGTYTLMSFYSDDGTTLVDHGLTSGLVIGTGLPSSSVLDYSSTLGEIRLEVIPEPSTMMLLGLCASLLWNRRRGRK